MRWNYSTSGNRITVTVTSINGAVVDLSGWLTANDLRNMGAPQAEINVLFSTMTGTYSLIGNTLTITMDGDTTTYTRQQ